MLTHILEFCVTLVVASLFISITILLLVGMVYFVRMGLQDMKKFFCTPE